MKKSEILFKSREKDISYKYMSESIREGYRNESCDIKKRNVLEMREKHMRLDV